MYNHYNHTYNAIKRKYEFCAKNNLELINWQNSLKKSLSKLLGLENIKFDLNNHEPSFEMHKSDDMGDYIREEWKMLTEPSVLLPFYVLRPKGQNNKLPLALTPHGHNHPHVYVGIANNPEEEKQIIEDEFDIACQTVKEGYLTIAPTTRAFGKTRTTIDQKNKQLSSCRSLLMQTLLIGRTPIGERVWDISRLIDWAINNQNIDSKRIAIVGNSGGATVALHAAACDNRISAVVASCYFCTYKGSIGSIYHCDCNYIPNILRIAEMYEIAGLIAPRPFLAIAGKKDMIFPIDQVQYAFNKLQEVYNVTNLSNNCKLHIGEGGHRHYKSAALNFIEKHFSSIEN